MGWTAHGTGSQRVSSGCTAGLPLRLAMATAVAVIIVMPSPSAAQEPPENTAGGVSRSSPAGESGRPNHGHRQHGARTEGSDH